MGGTLKLEEIEKALRANAELAPIQFVVVTDMSAGCGTSFSILVVSPAFEGVSLVNRHRMIHTALAAVMPSIHALQLRCLTPEVYGKKQSATA